MSHIHTSHVPGIIITGKFWGPLNIKKEKLGDHFGNDTKLHSTGESIVAGETEKAIGVVKVETSNK